ncbi:MAG: CDP-alcohol phosphatidyltransferase family protein [Putridiphycobacter sp.]|nr:CDP-alcohol phosphatidyltransferase family protein [Putridiphycobacter sp.]
MQAIKRLIPNLLTAGNLVGGIMAIIFTLTGKIELAPYCIFLSAIFDFLDGFVARLLNVQSELGKQLDSLADMVTFGVAPGIIMMAILQAAFRRFYYPEFVLVNDPLIEFVVAYGHFFSLIIPVFALFRLAKFNLDTRQTDSFIGLPTPAMTLFFAVFPILVLDYTYPVSPYILQEATWQSWVIVHMLGHPIVLIIVISIMSIFMVSEIHLFSLKFKHFKFKGNEIRFIFLTICVVLLATLFLWAIPLIIILYIILSLINNAIKPKHEV